MQVRKLENWGRLGYILNRSPEGHMNVRHVSRTKRVSLEEIMCQSQGEGKEDEVNVCSCWEIACMWRISRRECLLKTLECQLKLCPLRNSSHLLSYVFFSSHYFIFLNVTYNFKRPSMIPAPIISFQGVRWVVFDPQHKYIHIIRS